MFLMEGKSDEEKARINSYAEEERGSPLFRRNLDIQNNFLSISTHHGPP
jgi:hypothetical protein